VLDHVKDAIITIDATGHIATINVTGHESSRSPRSGRCGPVARFLIAGTSTKALTEALDNLAARVDDTQFDLAPHETLGVRANGARFSAGMAVSKSQGQPALVYIVCLRDPASVRALRLPYATARRVNRTLVEHAPESSWVFDLDQRRLIDLNENAGALFR